MVGDFNIKKFLTENKVTAASQQLAEFEMGPIVGDDGKPMGGLAASGSAGMGSFGPGIKTELNATNRPGVDRIDEFEILLKEFAEAKAKLDDLEKRKKEMVDVLKPMFLEMKELGEKLATVENSNKFIEIQTHGFDRVQPDYKTAFENGLAKVNAATRKVLEDCLAIANAAKKPSYIAPKFNIGSNEINEGAFDKVKSVLGKAVSVFTRNADKAAKAVEDFINLVADNVPGGEDVDDTPNPVLENAPKMPPMPQSTDNKPKVPGVPPLKSSVDKINLKPANMDVKNPSTFAKTLYDMAKKLIAGEGQGFNPETDANIKIAMNALRKAAKIPALPETSLNEELGGADFKVGDTVSDPEQLGPGPEFDGKVLAVFPNLEAAKGKPGYDSMIDFIKRFPQNAEAYDINGKWYQIEWRSEGTGLYSEKDMEKVIIAPDGRDFDDYEDEEDSDDDYQGIRYKWDWKDRNG